MEKQVRYRRYLVRYISTIQLMLLYASVSLAQAGGVGEEAVAYKS